MSDFSIETTPTGVAIDTRWRASTHGEDSARPAQAKAAGFTTGQVKSGTAVSRTGTKYKKWAVGETLAGFVNDDSGFTVSGELSEPLFALLVHGIVNTAHITGATHAEIVAATTTGNFVFVTGA